MFRWGYAHILRILPCGLKRGKVLGIGNGIDGTDRAYFESGIEEIVYNLYGLTQEKRDAIGYKDYHNNNDDEPDDDE